MVGWGRCYRSVDKVGKRVCCLLYRIGRMYGMVLVLFYLVCLCFMLK